MSGQIKQQQTIKRLGGWRERERERERERKREKEGERDRKTEGDRKTDGDRERPCYFET